MPLLFQNYKNFIYNNWFGLVFLLLFTQNAESVYSNKSLDHDKRQQGAAETKMGITNSGNWKCNEMFWWSQQTIYICQQQKNTPQNVRNSLRLQQTPMSPQNIIFLLLTTRMKGMFSTQTRRKRSKGWCPEVGYQEVNLGLLRSPLSPCFLWPGEAALVTWSMFKNYSPTWIN